MNVRWDIWGRVAFLLSILMTGNAHGQQPVATQPYVGATTQNGSGTVTVTNTFQSIFAQTGKLNSPATNQARVSCTVQNNSASNPMYVCFGPLASCTTGNSVKLASGGQSVSCVAGGIALQDQVSITGTSGDAFYAAQQ